MTSDISLKRREPRCPTGKARGAFRFTYAALFYLHSRAPFLIAVPPAGLRVWPGLRIERRIFPPKPRRTDLLLRHPCSSPASTATGLLRRKSRPDLRPSSCGNPPVRTPARTADETDGLRGSVPADRSHAV